ncbi:unnamed protein product [Callosobruchus maculatus]|uniref:Reverse transcriptase domain-containing protein n=1 Tax=Callosobruchus maculatus TaxID=64391 RepID=A0A653CQ89_CALMS|nr:unnamed protein product [Callosobruchus maculatus]
MRKTSSAYLENVNRQTDRQTDRPTDRQTDRPTDRQTDRPTDRQTDRPTDRQTDRPTDRQTDRQTDKLTDRATETSDVDFRYVDIIKRPKSQLNESNSALVTIDGKLSSQTATRKGVRQGCVLSPILFNIYSEFVMRQEELVALLNILEQHSAAYGLGINYNKTKLMIVDREHDHHRAIKSVGRFEVVQSFVYLRSLIDNSDSCENKIQRRIQQARMIMTMLTKIWRDRNITKATKMSLVQSLVFSIFLYTSETWTVNKADRARIDDFEM